MLVRALFAKFVAYPLIELFLAMGYVNKFTTILYYDKFLYFVAKREVIHQNIKLRYISMFIELIDLQ